jgi:hypothetical protein
MNADKAVEQQRSTGHPRIVAALLIVATLVTFLAIFSIWINRQALNTDNWVNTSDKLLVNDDIQAQLSPFLADQLFASVDVQAKLQKALPPRLQPLAAPLAGGLHQLAVQVAQRALDSPRVQSLWSDANRAAHETLLQIINGDNDGQVTLDLGSIVTQVGTQLGVSNVASKLPPDAGQLTIVKESQLSTIQKVAKLIRRLPIVLTLLVILLYGLAIYLAGPRRRQALRSVGIGFVIAGAIVLIGHKLAGGAVVDELAQTEAAKPAANAVWSIGTSLLVTVATSALAFGILLIIGAWLAGPTRLATRLRREVAPYARENLGAVYLGAGIVYLALIAFAPIAAFRKPLGLLIFAVLLAVGTELLRRQIVREFPGARPRAPATGGVT